MVTRFDSGTGGRVPSLRRAANDRPYGGRGAAGRGTRPLRVTEQLHGNLKNNAIFNFQFSIQEVSAHASY